MVAGIAGETKPISQEVPGARGIVLIDRNRPELPLGDRGLPEVPEFAQARETFLDQPSPSSVFTEPVQRRAQVAAR